MGNEYWYHTIELPDGNVTRGTYDLRPYLSRYGFPESLDGKTALDVGAADGFFSFEFEKRGADVLAVDTHRYDGSLGIDPSPFARESYKKKYAEFTGGNRLLKVKKLLKSSVDFEYLSVYNLILLDREFDLVFCGDLVEHLKDPLSALESLRAVTKGLCIISLSNALPRNRLGKTARNVSRAIIKRLGLAGDFVVSDKLVEYRGYESGGSFFHFSPLAFREAMLASGFKEVTVYSEFNLPNLRTGRAIPHLVFHGGV